MKNYLSIVAVAFGMLLSVPSQAQVNFGVKAGLNVSKISFDKDIAKTENRAGFFVGPMAEVSIPIVGLGVDGAILYDQKNATVNDVDETFHYVDIPINLKYTVGLGDMAGIYFATGPQFSFNVGDKKIFKNTYSLKSSQFYWNVGAGVKLIKHLQVGYNYNIALGDTGDTFGEHINNFSFKNNTHQISVAYLF